MIVLEQKVILPSFQRGFHLITDHLVERLTILKSIKVGLLHVFLLHTSASLSINENADPTVRKDFERYFNHIVPEQTIPYEHTMEGSDDMPAHLKSSLLGVSVTVPVTNGLLTLGHWQGIYLCEHRDAADRREILATAIGQEL